MIKQEGRCDDCDGPECESCGGIPALCATLAPTKSKLKLLSDNQITDGVLREFIIKGLDSAALMAIDASIEMRIRQIEVLKELKLNISG